MRMIEVAHLDIHIELAEPFRLDADGETSLAIGSDHRIIPKDGGTLAGWHNRFDRALTSRGVCKAELPNDRFIQSQFCEGQRLIAFLTFMLEAKVDHQ